MTESRGMLTRSQKKSRSQSIRLEAQEILKKTKILVMVQLLGMSKKNRAVDPNYQIYVKAMYLI